MARPEELPDPEEAALAARRLGATVVQAEHAYDVSEPWSWVSPREIIEGGDDPGTAGVREPRSPRPSASDDGAPAGH